MTVNNLTLLDSTVFGEPSGNYDGSTNYFYGDPVKAVGYYRGQGSIETATIRVEEFEGIITVQATLNEDPALAAWIDIYEYSSASGTITEIHPVTVTGNFCFMRVYITEFNSGTIGPITLTY